MTAGVTVRREGAGLAWLAGRTVLALAMAVGSGAPAHAQGVPRAFRGLFAVADDPSNPRHRFDLSASLFAAVVDADVEGAGTIADDRLLRASSQGLTSIASYAFRGRRTAFESISLATVQHYSTLPGWQASRYFERLQFGVRITPRTDLRVRGGALYSPYYSFGTAIDPQAEEGEIDPAGPQQVLSVRKNLRLDGQIELIHRPSPRSEVSMEYSVAQTRFLDEAFDLATHRAGVRYRRGLTEHATLHLGYVYHQWQYGGRPGPTLRGHDVRAGIGYNRALPGSPRTRFGFDFGSVAAQQPGMVRVDMTGTAFVARQLSPGWLSAATYSRGVDVRAGLVEPLYYFSDTAAVTLAGTVARRAALRLVGSYVHGHFTAGELEDAVRSWNGTAGINLMVARVMSVHAEGTVSTLRLSRRLGPLTGLPTLVDASSLVAGLTVWFPVLR